MPVVSFVDPIGVHDPASGTVAPATWFTTLEADFRSITGRVACKIYNDTAEDYALPGPTTLSLPDIDFNNGMTTSTANTIIVPASYAGKYILVASVRMITSPSALNTVGPTIAINGTDTFMEVASRSGASGSANTFCISATAVLAVADAITMRVTTQGLADGDTDISVSYPSLSAFWLSA